MTETGKVAIAVALIGALSVVGAKLVEVKGKAASAPAIPAVPAASMTGTWMDKDGDAVVIEQSGAVFTVTRWSFAGFVRASGTLTDRRVTLAYWTRNTSGNCTGTLAVAGDEAVLACEEPGNSYRQVLRRAG